MSAHEKELAQTVALNSELLRLLTQVVINVTERAVDLGAFDQRAMVLRSDCEQLSAVLRDQEKQQQALRALFDLPI
jgi:hypothetical protein